MATGSAIRGRGAAANPPNRFEPLSYIPDPDDTGGFEEPGDARPETQFFTETSRSIITRNDSPDIPFDASLNPYRGCEHGCVYCYARPNHEHLGFSAGLDFETKIVVKEDAPELLKRELSSRRWRPRVLAMSGITDAYQPVERRLEIARRCLAVLARFRNPVVVITKNHLVTRDIDLLGELARYGAASVLISIATLDPGLALKMEPRASRPGRRLAAIRELARAGIPAGVLTAPVVPGLTEHELPAIVQVAAEAGAGHARYTVLRLPYAVKDLFAQWLERHYPDRKEKVLNRIRAMRGGRLNDPNFGSRMRGRGVFADQISALFKASCNRAGIGARGPELSAAAFRRPPGPQLSLFGGD